MCVCLYKSPGESKAETEVFVGAEWGGDPVTCAEWTLTPFSSCAGPSYKKTEITPYKKRKVRRRKINKHKALKRSLFWV